MAEFKDVIAEKIRNILPEMPQEALLAADHLVTVLGLQDLSELALVAEGDVSSFLGVFKARRLVQAWKESTTADNSHQEATHAAAVPGGGARGPAAVAAPAIDKYDFKIDWDDLYKSHDSVKDRLQRGKSLKSKQKRELIKRIVSQVRSKVPHAKRDIFRQIVRAMKKKYPIALSSELAQGKLNRKSLCSRMQNKFDNDRRPARRTRMEQQAPAIKSAYGCTKWRIANIPQGETEESLQQAQEDLVQYFETTRPSVWDWNYIEAAMKQTYRSQRQDINQQAEQIMEMEKKLLKEKRLEKNKKNKKNQNQNKENVSEQNQEAEEEDVPATPILSTEEIRDRWPFLFEPKCMFEHFGTLTDKNIVTAFLGFMETKVNKIIDFCVDTNSQEDKPKKIRKKIRRAKEQLPPYNAEYIGMLILLMQKFNEQQDALWMIIDPAAKEDDVPILCSVPKTPRLIVAGEDIFHPETIFFTMDKQVLGFAENMLEGIGLLFSSYFVFNLQYDAGAQVTLEFIQRFILEINPSNGNKRPKGGSGHSSNYKVHQLLTRFNSRYDDYYADKEQDSSDEN